MEEATILVILGGVIGAIATLALDHAVCKTRYIGHLKFLHDFDPIEVKGVDYGYHR